jgi:hypothetical protein
MEFDIDQNPYGAYRIETTAATHPSVADVFFRDTAEESVANARLIAAAPELLEACEMLLEDVVAMAEDPEAGRHWDWSLTERNLRNVIAKAKAA